MSPAGPGITRSSILAADSTGPNMAPASRSLTSRASSTGRRGSRLIETNPASRSWTSGVSASGPGIADPPPGPCRYWQMRMGRGHLVDAAPDGGLGGRHVTGPLVHVKAEMLGLGEDGPVGWTSEHVVKMQPLLVGFQHLSRYLNQIFSTCLSQECEMRLRSEEAAGAR